MSSGKQCMIIFEIAYPCGPARSICDNECSKTNIPRNTYLFSACRVEYARGRIKPYYNCACYYLCDWLFCVRRDRLSTFMSMPFDYVIHVCLVQIFSCMIFTRLYWIYSSIILLHLVFHSLVWRRVDCGEKWANYANITFIFTSKLHLHCI